MAIIETLLESATPIRLISKPALTLLSALAVAGIAAWTLYPAASDAESHPVAAAPAVLRSAENVSWFGPAVLREPATFTVPAAAISSTVDAASDTAAPAKPPVDGLRITSQSWRRGGLGSKALMTFTLQNANDYPVRDIELACSFTRRDGVHVTDRRRVIPDMVNMKSRKRYSGMLVGFVNVEADKARCSLVTASRI